MKVYSVRIQHDDRVEVCYWRRGMFEEIRFKSAGNYAEQSGSDSSDKSINLIEISMNRRKRKHVENTCKKSLEEG